VGNARRAGVGGRLVEMPVTIGNEVARIIGADTETVVMHQNVSICQALILSCLDPEPKRNKIVYAELEFPSVQYVYEAHARNGKFCIETVKSDDGMTIPTERLLAAIDEETLLVPLACAVQERVLQDARRITERAHQVGAMVVLDTYQSAGTVPFSVKELNVDFATGGSVKWLCGGPGAGYLYVRPDLQTRLEPRTTGWMAHEAPLPSSPAQFAMRPTLRAFCTARLRSLRSTRRAPAIASSTKSASPRSAKERAADNEAYRVG
jgi:kynureninase